MFSDAISSISWRCRPSSPLMAAAISGSASASVAVKNESGAEADLALEDEAVMEEISPSPQAFRRDAAGQLWRSKKCLRDTTSPGIGQALAVQDCYLCKIWWGWRGLRGSTARRPGLEPGPITTNARCGKTAS